MTRLACAGVLLAVTMTSTGCGNPISSTPLPPAAPPQILPAPPPATRPSAVALFGTVFERTAGAQTAIEGVMVYCDACGEYGHTFMTTDANGRYRFSGDLANGGGVWLGGPPMRLLVQKAGYILPGGVPINSASYPEGFWATVTMNGDTEFDIVLARR